MNWACPPDRALPRLERGPGARARVEEEHRQDLVAEVRMRQPEGALALQVHGHVEHGLDLLAGPLPEADQVATAKVRLHRRLLTPPRRGRARGAPSGGERR